jgi:hypothetical protein
LSFTSNQRVIVGLTTQVAEFAENRHYSLVSQGVSKKSINMLADSFDRLNGASLYGNASDE